jgi:plasmid stability protein
MKNITLSLDDDTYREARIAAAQRDQSVSAMVRELINHLTKHSRTAVEHAAYDRALSQATLAASAPAFAAAWDNTEDDAYNAL